MGNIVCNGAILKCSFGTVPGTMTVLPANMVMTATPIANIMDYIPMTNIMPFAMCTSMSNPTVAAATSAAQGVLTPMPCTPVTTAPWSPGSSTMLIANQPALNDGCTLMCAWGGTIEVTNAGQSTIEVQ